MKYKVALNNRIYEVEVEEGKAMLIDEYEAAAPAPSAPQTVPAPAAAAPAPASAQEVASGQQIKSPLPGTVLAVKVQPGQEVKEGDILMVVEAMKMENSIAAPSDGKVKQILKDKGAVVATGDVLLVI